MDMQKDVPSFKPALVAILSELRQSKPFTLLFPEYVTSSQDVARNHLVANGAPVFVSAECQTAGRGRHGRKWVSPKVGNIYMSIAFFTDALKGKIDDFTLRLANHMVDEFRAKFNVQLQVKQPNDLILDGAKVGGFLLENVPGHDAHILGVGMNLVQDPDLQNHCSQQVSAIGRAVTVEKHSAILAICSAIVKTANQ
jgi:BirA family biotin operon repressor/biotin-[acetyl-CoA-carboxylase] ligase